MIDQEIADLFAAQTVLMHLLLEELIKAGSTDRGEIINKLYRLLEEQNAGRPPSSRSGPIRHLIKLTEALVDSAEELASHEKPRAPQ